MKKIKIASHVLILMSLILFTQCYYDDVLPDIDIPDNKTEVSFQNDIIPIFNASCNGSGCHNTGGTAPDLTPQRAYNALINGDYVDVSVPENSELFQWMKGNRALPMPLTGPNANYNSLILQWIKQGALNN